MGTCQGVSSFVTSCSAPEFPFDRKKNGLIGFQRDQLRVYLRATCRVPEYSVPAVGRSTVDEVPRVVPVVHMHLYLYITYFVVLASCSDGFGTLLLFHENKPRSVTFTIIHSAGLSFSDYYHSSPCNFNTIKIAT